MVSESEDLQCSPDLPLYYCSAGNSKGKPLIMIHGWGADHRYFDYQLEAFNDYRLIIPDLEGFGSSSSKDVPKRFSIGEQAGKVHSLAQSLGVREAVVIGHSMGGMVAQELALSYPEFVKGLVLEDTSPGLRHVSLSSNLTRFYPLIYFAPKFLRVATARRWAIFHHNASDAAIGIIEEYARITCCKVLVRYTRAMREWSSMDRLERIAIPILCIHGEKDRLLSKEHTDIITSKLPSSRTISVPDSGHTPHLESPEVFNETVRKYLQEIDW